MKRLALIVFVFVSSFSFGQFSDSLMIKNFFDSNYDFDFFRINNVKRMRHFSSYFEDGKLSYTNRDYELSFDVYKNIITKRYSKKYKEFYREGPFGEPIECFDLDCTMWDSSYVLEFYDNGKVYRYDDYYYKYDSLNRISIIAKWQGSTYWRYYFTYRNNKVREIKEIHKESDTIIDTLTYKFFYNSPSSFGYFLKFPARMHRADDQFFYLISDDRKRLEISYYYWNELYEKYIDEIIE